MTSEENPGTTTGNPVYLMVKLSELKEHLEFRNKINTHDLGKIILMRNDREYIPFSKGQIENWKYIGLNNIDFLRDFLDD